MKILVTGGAGFVGSRVAGYYAENGEEVVLFDNLSRARILRKELHPLYNWSHLKNEYSNIRLIGGDVRDFDAVKEASKDADVILHMAAQVAVTTSLVEPRIDFEINALGTFNVLEAARINDATVIYCSTNKVYGENVNRISVKDVGKRYCFSDERYSNGIPEEFPIDLCGHSPYGCSKLAGDLYAQDYASAYGLKTGVFRMSCIYGERQFGVEDQGWLAWFTIATLNDRPVTIYGDGKQVRDVLYVADLVEAFDAFVKGNLKHEVFNIGGGPKNTLSLLELLDLLKEFTGKEATVSFADWRSVDQKVYVSDISKAITKLHWKPKTSVRDGVEKLVAWVSNNLSLL